ncbi:MAG: hypothetical protein JNL01_13155 [Bdellovibrionales bacterium]|nr:hypothetical protein [Bdellovibrionales bacterium]
MRQSWGMKKKIFTTLVLCALFTAYAGSSLAAPRKSSCGLSFLTEREARAALGIAENGNVIPEWDLFVFDEHQIQAKAKADPKLVKNHERFLGDTMKTVVSLFRKDPDATPILDLTFYRGYPRPGQKLPDLYARAEGFKVKPLLEALAATEDFFPVLREVLYRTDAEVPAYQFRIWGKERGSNEFTGDWKVELLTHFYSKPTIRRDLPLTIAD